MRDPGLSPGRATVRLAGVLACVAGLGAACRTLPALAPADLTAPGWQMQQGQAVWRPGRAQPELVGELLVATNANGDFLVRFSKPPFPLALARAVGGRWQLEMGLRAYRRTGRGRPPARVAWFQLPLALGGAPLGRPWRFERLTPNSWRLENRRTGERLEGLFFP